MTCFSGIFIIYLIKKNWDAEKWVITSWHLVILPLKNSDLDEMDGWEFFLI